MKIAVVGSGISGLSCAYRLVQDGHEVSLFEAGGHFGGHSNTVDVSFEGVTHGVDTGFLVFNHRTYPQLTALFAELGVDTAASDMGFSVKLPAGGRVLEWAGGNLDQVFCQRANLLRPAFLRMLRDILRFNRAATALAQSGFASLATSAPSLGSYLDAEGYSAQFRSWYLLPMAACIWSCPADQMLAFPLASFVQFCHNHGLLQVNDRPQWRTVRGGSRVYVRRLLEGIPQRHLNTPVQAIARTIDGVALRTPLGNAVFDEVVLACHSDQSLALLTDATDAERRLLSAVRYQANRAVLHTDTSCLPQQRKAWSAWNYQGSGDAVAGPPRVCVHYLLNMLQPLPFTQPVIVSLNPLQEPDPRTVLREFDYAHPVFDAAAVAAQQRLPQIQGGDRVWFAGAWTGYGFHEDGLKSGLAVAAAIAARSRVPHAA